MNFFNLLDVTPPVNVTSDEFPPEGIVFMSLIIIALIGVIIISIRSIDKSLSNPNKNPPQKIMENQKLPTPITCPVCGSRELAFVSEVEKSFIAKALCTPCLIIAVLFLGKIIISTAIPSIEVSESDIGLFLIAAVLYIGLNFFVYVTERKSHVCAICKDCGYIWTLN